MDAPRSRDDARRHVRPRRPGPRVPGLGGERENGARRVARGQADRGPLHAGLSAACIDRAVVRRRASRRRQAHRVDAQPGRFPAARRHGARARCRPGEHHLHPRGRLGVLRAERRGRCGLRRGARRARPPRPAGEAAVDARGRVHVGAVRLGDDHEDARRSRCVGSHRRLAARALELPPHDAPRRARGRQSACRLVRREPLAADVPRRRAAAVGRRRSQRDSALRFSDPAHREALSTGAAAPHLGAADPGRVCERLRARVVHGRDGGRGRRRPGRVPVAAPHRSSRPGGDRGGGTQGRLATGRRSSRRAATRSAGAASDSPGTRIWVATARLSPKSKSIVRAASCA